MNVPRLLWIFALSLALACGDDGGPAAVDAGGRDAGPADGGVMSTDAGATDAGAADAGAASQPLRVFVEMAGAAVGQSESEAPSVPSSTVLLAVGSDADIPPLDDALVAGEGNAADTVRADIRTVLGGIFAEFPVEVVSERPTGDDWVLVVLGGDANDAGAPFGSLKFAAGDCGDTAGPGAVVFVFPEAQFFFRGAETYAARIDRVATIAAQTIGHSLGLDTVVGCGDVMSYGVDCAPGAAFTAESRPCGADRARECTCGGSEQSSAAHLEAILGSS